MSAFNTPWFNSQDRSFFNSLNKSTVSHIVLTAETEDFADEVTQQWRDEGFHVVYVPLEGSGNGNEYVARVKQVGESLGVSEQYAVVGNTSRPGIEPLVQRVVQDRVDVTAAKATALTYIIFQPSAMPLH
jgi:hypothetical protein